MVKRPRGFTMMEIVVTLALFGVFLMIIVTITLEMRKTEKRYPVNFMVHPEVAGLVARMRKDVFDTKYYPATFQSYEQTEKTLILYTLQQTGFAETVVYDFTTDGEVHRKSYNASQLTGDWIARGVPTFKIDAFTLGSGQQAVRITAADKNGKLGIDEIFVPRPHD